MKFIKLTDYKYEIIEDGPMGFLIKDDEVFKFVLKDYNLVNRIYTAEEL